MAARNGILLLTTDPEAVDEVTVALASSGRFQLARVCHDLRGLEAELESARASAVLVDIDPEPEQVLSGLAPLVARFGDARFIVVAGALRNDLLVAAMQIGARHYIAKESIRAELPGALGRLVPEGYAGGPGQGTVITVLSATGGCGATTLAINLANELALEGDEAALLIDADAGYGAAAPYLGLQAQYGIADVLSYDGQIDEHLIRSSAAQYSETLHVLLSPRAINFSQPQQLRFEALGGVLDACRSAYPYTVIDAPRLPNDACAMVARASGLAVLVLQLTVKDIHLARSLEAALIERGVPREQLVLVANRYHRRSPIALKEAEDALGGATLTLVRNDFRAAMRGLTYGQPLAQAAPRSVARKDIRQLALDVARTKAPASRTRSKR